VSPEDGLLAVLWVLNLSDGNHDLLAIAERAELRFDVVRRAADLLEENGLLEEVVSGAPRSHGAVS
jgi:aminopeptidase-like protein